MPLSSLPIFEKSNDALLNVYQIEGKKLVFVFFIKNKSSKRRNNYFHSKKGEQVSLLPHHNIPQLTAAAHTIREQT